MEKHKVVILKLEKTKFYFNVRFVWFYPLNKRNLTEPQLSEEQNKWAPGL
jgi:hypothetical protein